VPWKCLKCGYESSDHEGQECPDCGGKMEEADSEVDWLADKEKKDLSNPNVSKKEDSKDDLAL